MWVVGYTRALCIDHRFEDPAHIYVWPVRSTGRTKAKKFGHRKLQDYYSRSFGLPESSVLVRMRLDHMQITWNPTRLRLHTLLPLDVLRHRLPSTSIRLWLIQGIHLQEALDILQQVTLDILRQVLATRHQEMQ